MRTPGSWPSRESAGRCAWFPKRICMCCAQCTWAQHRRQPRPVNRARGLRLAPGRRVSHGACLCTRQLRVRSLAAAAVTVLCPTCICISAAYRWGILIPAGIVMARCFKELDPLWFTVHR